MCLAQQAAHGSRQPTVLPWWVGFKFFTAKFSPEPVANDLAARSGGLPMYHMSVGVRRLMYVRPV